jgi:2-polyprenyl-3-methyl-5-hydroxy-6-metoxy-1,4-benzoquinol methylase
MKSKLQDRTESVSSFEARAAASREAQLQAVRAFWNENVDKWKSARCAPPAPEFFAETEVYRFEKLDYLPRLVDFAGCSGQRVLDVGCGLGNDLSRFAKGGAIVTGIDLSPRAIELARLNFEQRGLPGEFLQMNGEAMTFPAGTFDLVYCHTVLHFTPSPQAMIREIQRVLKPGGTAVLMTLNRNSWMNVLRVAMRVEIDHLDSPVYRRFTFDELRAMLSGFASVRIEFAASGGASRSPRNGPTRVGWLAAWRTVVPRRRAATR